MPQPDVYAGLNPVAVNGSGSMHFASDTLDGAKNGAKIVRATGQISRNTGLLKSISGPVAETVENAADVLQNWATPLTLGVTVVRAYEDYKAKNNRAVEADIAEGGGTMAGIEVGAATGTVLGGPGVGTLVGGIVGGVVGGKGAKEFVTYFAEHQCVAPQYQQEFNDRIRGQRENRHEAYEKALVSGNENTATTARAEYAEYITHLAMHGILTAKGYNQAMEVVTADFKTAQQKNQFLTPEAAQQKAMQAQILQMTQNMPRPKGFMTP